MTIDERALEKAAKAAWSRPHPQAEWETVPAVMRNHEIAKTRAAIEAYEAARAPEQEPEPMKYRLISACGRAASGVWQWDKIVDAILAEIRTPTPGMVEAGLITPLAGFANRHAAFVGQWQSAIDAIAKGA